MPATQAANASAAPAPAATATAAATATSVAEDARPGFTWDDYLQSTGAVAADADAFKHVEQGHASLCKRGSLFALPWESGADPPAYWFVRIVTASGPLLAVEFVGGDQRPVWYNVNSRTAASLDWCRRHRDRLRAPPEAGAGNEESLYRACVDDGDPMPCDLAGSGQGLQPIDHIVEGRLLECSAQLDPYALWFVQVASNRGGRLRLRWMDEACERPADGQAAFHLFYTSRRLHPLGFGHAQIRQHGSHKFFYSPSFGRQARVHCDTAQQLTADWQAAVPDSFLRPFELPPPHKFKVGYKLEAINPLRRHAIQPATVASVIDQYFFVVELDDLRPAPERQSVRRLCTAATCEVMPANFSFAKAVKLTPPPGYSGCFSWSAYLTSQVGPDGLPPYTPPESYFQLPDEEFDFCLGEKLEMVCLEDETCLAPATISRFIGRLVVLHLNHLSPLAPPIFVDMGSASLFHVGWGDLNGHRVLTPFCYQQAAHHRRLLALNPPSAAWCSKIYINNRCHVGPSLSKSAVDALPKSLGPGEIGVVLEDVLSRVVQAAYNPTKVLKDIERDPEEPRDGLIQRPMKAKFKGKSYSSVVQLCSSSVFLDEYLKQVCIRLKACPYFISVYKLRVSCPECCPARVKKLSNAEKLPNLRRRVAPKSLQPSGSAAELPALDQEDDSCQGNYAYNDDDLVSNNSSGGDQQDQAAGAKVQTRGVRLPTCPTLERRKRKAEQAAAKRKSLTADAPPLISNPLHWTVEELYLYLKSNTDLSDDICELLVAEKVDGQAFLLLNLPAVESALGLPVSAAIKLCHFVWQLKKAFFHQFTDYPV